MTPTRWVEVGILVANGLTFACTVANYWINRRIREASQETRRIGREIATALERDRQLRIDELSQP